MNQDTKKISAILVVGILTLGVLAYIAFKPVKTAPETFGDGYNGGILVYPNAGNGTATNYSVTCPNNTSTVIAAAASSRTYFDATDNSSTAITVCFDNGTGTACTAGAGTVLQGSGGAYEPNLLEAVWPGNIVCVGNGASSSIGGTYIQ